MREGGQQEGVGSVLKNYINLYLSICYAIVSVCLSYFRLVCGSFDLEDCVCVLTYNNSCTSSKIKGTPLVFRPSVSVCQVVCVSVCLLNSCPVFNDPLCLSPFVCQYQESVPHDRMGPCGRKRHILELRQCNMSYPVCEFSVTCF